MANDHPGKADDWEGIDPGSGKYGEKIYLGTIHKKTRKTRERACCPLSLKPIVYLWIKRGQPQELPVHNLHITGRHDPSRSLIHNSRNVSQRLSPK